jgi:hypothetical protein
MCYLSCRCTRSISVVPPVAYAQLAAKRGRCMVEEVVDEDGISERKVSLGPNYVQKLSMLFFGSHPLLLSYMLHITVFQTRSGAVVSKLGAPTHLNNIYRLHSLHDLMALCCFLSYMHYSQGRPGWTLSCLGDGYSGICPHPLCNLQLTKQELQDTHSQLRRKSEQHP